MLMKSKNLIDLNKFMRMEDGVLEIWALGVRK
jgi:hypothetical protein